MPARATLTQDSTCQNHCAAVLDACWAMSSIASERRQTREYPFRRTKLSSDRVDGREGGKAAQHTYGLLGCDPAHGANRLLRVVCGVRCDDDVVKLKERVGRAPVSLFGRLLLDVVERRAGNPSFGECLMDCRVLDDRATRRIDEDGGRLHPPQRHPIEQVAGLRRKRRLDDQIVRGFDKPIEGNGPHILLLHVGRIEERIIRPDVDAEWPHAFRDAACDCAERYEAENAPTDAPDRVTRLPAPFASPDCPVVLTDLADSSEPERDGVVGNLLGTPLVRGVRDLYAATCGGVDIDNIRAGAVPGDHTAAREGVDGARANRRILGEDAVGIASLLDDFVFTLALRGENLEPRTLDDGALDIHVAEVVVRDQNRALRFCILLYFHWVPPPLNSPHRASIFTMVAAVVRPSRPRILVAEPAPSTRHRVRG